MAPTDDFRPRRKFEDSGLSATVPDILAPTAIGESIATESTYIQLSRSGRLCFPGSWQLDRDQNEGGLLFYRPAKSLSANLFTGPLSLTEEQREFLVLFFEQKLRTLSELDLRVLQKVFSAYRSGNYELCTGSTELLQGKMVLVLQGYLAQTQMKEALMIFPETGSFAHISICSTREEFGFYFNLLRMALKSIEWS